jgi:HipA-like protein
VLPRVRAISYVTPLREGGSLPAVMEADDLGTYVVKFRGAGQGRKALIAEIISACLAQACGLAVPDLVAVDLDPALAPGEPDQEIQDLLRASDGLNLGVDFLPGALDFETGAATVDKALAGRIVWFDALIANADRSWRNPNMLLWHGTLYLIDHGAALTFHHRWASAGSAAARPYDIAEHALLGCGALVDDADAELAPRLTTAVLRDAARQVPDEWLTEEPGFAGIDQLRDAYVDQLTARLAARPSWVPPLAAAARAGLANVTAADRAGRRTGRPAWLTGPSPGTKPSPGESAPGRSAGSGTSP